MSQSRLVKYIPESVVFERVPLADEQNAYWLWLEAAKNCYEPLDEDTNFWTLICFDCETGEGMKYPSGKEAERVCEILDKNRRAFELIDEGIARGAFQIPESVSDDEQKQLHSCMAAILEISIVKVRRLLSEGCLDAAVQVCIGLGRIGSLIESSPTAIRSIQGLAAIANSHATTIAELLIDNNKLSRSPMQALLNSLRQQHETTDGFVEGLCFDICYNILNRLDRIPDDTDTEGVLDAILEEHYENELCVFAPADGGPDPAAQAELEQQVAWRREKILYILDGHPCPFDKRATARLIGEHVVDVEAVFQKSLELQEWEFPGISDRPFVPIRAELGSWPVHLTPDWIVDFMGNTPFAQAQLKEFHACSGSDYYHLPPTKEDLIIAREKIATVSNPLGKLVLDYDCRKINQLCDIRLLFNANTRKLEAQIEERLQ